MAWFQFAFVSAIALTAVSAFGDPPNVVPLDQIWALDMPGTRDVRELEPDNFGDKVRELPADEQFRLLDESLTEQIDKTLRPPHIVAPGPVKEPEPKNGFAVSGIGVEALQNAKAVLCKTVQPNEKFDTTTPISVVFTSNQSVRYAHLVRVTRTDNVVEIQYRSIPHESRDLTSHFALIPLGKLLAGEYRVNVTRLPESDNRETAKNSVGTGRNVSKSFSFEVTEKKQD